MIASRIVVLVVISLFSGNRIAFAQENSADPDTKSGVLIPVEVEEKLRKGLHITPIIQRFSAVRGKTISFEFDLETRGIATTLQVKPVAIKQMETGVILPDDQGTPPPELLLETPAQIKMTENDQAKIRGRIRVPRSQARFHSFGIIVLNQGEAGELKPKDPTKPSVGIRYKTQYLLRCDLTVKAARGEDIRQVKFEAGGLVPVQGRSLARVYLSNPTDSLFEFQMRSRLRQVTYLSKQKDLLLHLPVRENMSPPQKHLIRLLPESLVRVEEFLKIPVFPGTYELEVDLLVNGRVLNQVRFPVRVSEADFPAQQVQIKQLLPGVLMTPTQIELSLQKGGSRIRSLTLYNNTSQEVSIDLTAEPIKNSSVRPDWLSIRPQRLTLSPNSQEKVLVTLAPSADLDSHWYTNLTVHARSKSEETHLQIPVVRRGRALLSSELVFAELGWLVQNRKPSFVLPVKNNGQSHAELNGQIVLISETTRKRYECNAGFGKWLLPGESTQLKFQILAIPPPGRYQLLLKIQRGPGEEPMFSRRLVKIPAI